VIVKSDDGDAEEDLKDDVVLLLLLLLLLLMIGAKRAFDRSLLARHINVFCPFLVY